MSQPLVAAIVPTHNRRERLLETLGLLYQSAGVNLGVVVVFDGCTDGSQQAVRQRFPQVLQVEGDGNLWWSGAINAGIAAAARLNPDYVCLMNDDVEPHPHMLSALVDAAQTHPGAIVGPLICFKDRPNVIWCAGGRVNWLGRGPWMHGNGAAHGPHLEAPIKAQWLPGMGTLVPWNILQQLGGMDARNFPQYFGDTDFTLRACKAGIPLLVCPQARLYNDVASTGMLLPSGPIGLGVVRTLLWSQRSHSNLRTRFRFWMRHCPWPLIPWQAVRFYTPLMAAIARKMLLQPVHALRRKGTKSPQPAPPS